MMKSKGQLTGWIFLWITMAVTLICGAIIMVTSLTHSEDSKGITEDEYCQNPMYGEDTCRCSCKEMDAKFLKFDIHRWGTPNKCTCYKDGEVIVI